MGNLVQILTDVGVILAISLVFGAGIPVIFSFGVKALSPDPATDGSAATTTNPAHRVLAVVCFGLCIAAVVAGIALVIIGGR